MPLKTILFRPGVNRENTRYASETLGSVKTGSAVVAGWYESDKIRFRQGTPEKIGGWTRFSGQTFLGVCRSLWGWVNLEGTILVGVGTHVKFYINRGGFFYDVTPFRSEVTLAGPFTATAGSSIINVHHVDHGCLTGDYVNFADALGLGGNITADVFNQPTDISFIGFQVTVLDEDNYTINVDQVSPGLVANASDTGNGGAAVVAKYQLNIGPDIQLPDTGWGAGPWGEGPWGIGITELLPLRIWVQDNFGEDLLYGPIGGQLYYWDATLTVNTRGRALAELGGDVSVTTASPAMITLTKGLTEGTLIQLASTGTLPSGISAGTTYQLVTLNGLDANLMDLNGNLVTTTTGYTGQMYISKLVDVPLAQNWMLVSDASRFIFAFGTNDYGSAVVNPLLIRWSDQENPYVWTPSATNQAGSILLSRGSSIITALQTRQEIVVFTDTSLYSLQFVGAPAVWGSQLLGDNISIMGPKSATLASGVVYWMGKDKFYTYDGRVQTLNSDLRRHVFENINQEQNQQVFCTTNEGFNEVWWFYCSKDSVTIDQYVVYNYVEKIWYYGTLARTAWLDTGIFSYPIATTYNGVLLYHENGTDDDETGTPQPIYARISSAEFDIDDGHNFGFVWRLLPDITFRDSTGALTPQATMTLSPMQNSGSGINTPPSRGGSDNAAVARVASATIEEFTGQVYIRVRGRQLIFTCESNRLGTTWQLGAPRIDIRPDGRRGNT